METIFLNSDFYRFNPDMFEKILNEVFKNLIDLTEEYPDFRFWFYSILKPGILLGERVIIIKVFNERIVGMSILKSTFTEKKICTFRVISDYQKMGIGTELMRQSIIELETTKPLITVSETRVYEFSKLFETFSFKNHSEKDSYYIKDKKEFIFNHAL